MSPRATAIDLEGIVRASVRVERVMELLDLDERTVRRLLDQGDLAGHGIGKRGIRVYLDSIRAYQEARTITAKHLSRKEKSVRSAASRASHTVAEAALRKSGILS